MSASVGAATSAVRSLPTRIRLMRHGCANRPFFHIVICQKGRKVDAEPIEQIGTFDPLPNRHNEKLVAIDVERLKYWIAQGSIPTPSAGQLLGLSGFLPIHPRTYLDARRRQAAVAATQEQQQHAAEGNKAATSNEEEPTKSSAASVTTDNKNTDGSSV